MIKLKSIIKEIVESYYSNMSDDEKHALAMSYFNIGHDGPDGEEPDKHYCWMWNGNDIVYKKGGTHSCNFGHEVADTKFKGWYDVNTNTISVSFPAHELRKLGDRKPTEDDIPQYLYTKLISKFGKRKPKFAVFEHVNSKYVGSKNKDEFSYAGRYPVVVGVIPNNGEIKSKETTRNHDDIGVKFGKKWRYNPKTKIIYWWGEYDENDVRLVTEHLKHEYGYDVINNVSLRDIDRSDVLAYTMFLNQSHGHINEQILAEATLRGEWWFDDGQAIFADGDVGDVNHEGYVIDILKRQIIDALGGDASDLEHVEDFDDCKDEIFQEIGNDLDRKEREDWEEGQWFSAIMSYVKRKGSTELKEKLAYAFGNKDAREYALIHWGWQRVKGNVIQTQTLTRKDLEHIVSGLWEAYGEELNAEPGEEEHTFFIEVMSTRSLYENVPISVLEKKDPTALNQYRTRY